MWVDLVLKILHRSNSDPVFKSLSRFRPFYVFEYRVSGASCSVESLPSAYSTLLVCLSVFNCVGVSTGPSVQSPACQSFWSLRRVNWSSSGRTSVDTTASTSTVTAARPSDRRRWMWTAKMRGTPSGSGKRPPW